MFTSFKPAIAVLKLPALLVSAARGACTPSSLLHRDLRGVVLRLHLPEEELDGVLHEAGDGHRADAARNWGNY